MGRREDGSEDKVNIEQTNKEQMNFEDKFPSSFDIPGSSVFCGSLPRYSRNIFLDLLDLVNDLWRGGF